MLNNKYNKKIQQIVIASFFTLFVNTSLFSSLKPDSIDRADDIKKYNEILIKLNKNSRNNKIHIEKIDSLSHDINSALSLNLNFKKEINNDTLLFEISPSQNKNINVNNIKIYNKLIKDKIRAIKNNKILQYHNIKSISPNIAFKMQMKPNDSRYNEQWNYFEPIAGINLPEAWELSTGNKNTVIAVLDTGITNHENLKDKILPGKNFIDDLDSQDDYWDHGNGTSYHGTHVAGIIAANGNKLNDISGIDWKAKILPIKVLGDNGVGNLGAIANGIRYATGIDEGNDNPAKIINLSLGSYEDECPDILQDEINRAIEEKNVTFVVAAGNSGIDAKKMTPANCKGVITVAAVNRNGLPAYYTNHGDKIDIAAPGGEQYNYYMKDGILSTTYPGHFEYMQGTSMAAPHVAGVVALMQSIDPTLTPDRIKEILQNTSRGYVMKVGILDANYALEYTKLLS